MSARGHHGHAKRGDATKTYRAWQNMRRRCTDPTNPQFADYGGRGITVCAEWNNFPRFLADMGEAPAEKSLDRKDNNQGYSKENCRWATRREQNQNTRKNVFIGYNGERRCISEWARILNLPMLTLYDRLVLRKWGAEKAFTTPAISGMNQFGGEAKITFGGATRTVHEWATKLNLRPGTLHMRLWRGWSLERALS